MYPVEFIQKNKMTFTIIKFLTECETLVQNIKIYIYIKFCKREIYRWHYAICGYQRNVPSVVEKLNERKLCGLWSREQSFGLVYRVFSVTTDSILMLIYEM
jgi:hypothetical protein